MNFTDNWSSFHNDWSIYNPNRNNVYKINTFDDGNIKYSEYINEWYIYGNWKGKIAILNKHNTNVQIGSISSWKVDKIEDLLLSNNPA